MDVDFIYLCVLFFRCKIPQKVATLTLILFPQFYFKLQFEVVFQKKYLIARCSTFMHL